MDINDCIPTFSLFSYDEPVLENLPAGVVVTTVAATDYDTGSNAVIRYTIVAGDLSVFEVDCEYILFLKIWYENINFTLARLIQFLEAYIQHSSCRRISMPVCIVW